MNVNRTIKSLPARLLVLLSLGVLLLACTVPGAAPKTPATSIPTAEIFQPSATSPAAQSTPTNAPGSLIDPDLTDFDFITSQNGWGVTKDALVYTADGGKSWTPLTIKGVDSFEESVTYFLNANSAWVLLPNPDRLSGKVYHTSDKGSTWAAYDFPYPTWQMQFFDAQFGIIIAPLDAGAGSMAVAVAYTVDAGETWKEVYVNDPNREGASDTLPLSGMKTGMTFSTPANGWVTGTKPQDGFVYLYRTENGGVSWQHQNLPLPEGMQNAQVILERPQFFNANEGVLPVTFFQVNNESVGNFYKTTDGGQTWKLTSNTDVTNHAYWFDLTHGWNWDGTQLHRTTDGGMTWQTLEMGFPETSIQVKLDFVTAEQGWALVREDETTPAKLFFTLNGGKNWGTIVP